MEDLIIEYDKNKTKILKYIMYKKRTENEIIQKFSNAIEKDMLEDIIEELKENGYINDKLYIQKAVIEYMSLQNLSIKEIEYKLYSKGISSDIIETYFKQQTMSEDEIRIFLRKKGYNQDTIKQAFSDD